MVVFHARKSDDKMPTKTKEKRELSWINVFFFFVISMLMLLVLTMIGLVVVNAVRPDIGDKFRIAVASKMLQEDFQSLLDDRAKLVVTRDAEAVSQLKMNEFQKQLDSLKSELIKSKEAEEKANAEAANAKKMLSKVERVVEDLEIKLGESEKRGQPFVKRDAPMSSGFRAVEEIVALLKARALVVQKAGSTADKIDAAKNEISTFDEWVRAFNDREQIRTFKGKLIDIEPGKSTDSFVAVVRMLELGVIDKGFLDPLSQAYKAEQAIRVEISSLEKSTLKVGDLVGIDCRIRIDLQPKTLQAKEKGVRFLKLYCGLFHPHEINTDICMVDAKLVVPASE